MHSGVLLAEHYSPRSAMRACISSPSCTTYILSLTEPSTFGVACLQLCSLCEDNDDIVLLKIDWDQNKPIARPLGVKVSFLATCCGVTH